MEYTAKVVKYLPKADDMAKEVERMANEMAVQGWELVTMSVTNSAKAIMVFKKD